jgi:predicted AAA+ superfamily ATPase
MDRIIYKELLKWKRSKTKKPLIVQGARQVGKTFLIEEFCKREYKKHFFINLFMREDLVSLYEEKRSSDNKFAILKSVLGEEIEGKDRIVFIDEIQESETLISELKYFREKHPNLNIICAGSLLGVKLKRLKKPFPVGQVKTLFMHPMNFEEFLLAAGEADLADMIRDSFASDEKMPNILHTKAMDLYRIFLCVGGMPEQVLDYIKNEKDLTKMDGSIIDEIRENYFDDMNKYILNKNEGIKIRKTYESVSVQITNESNKFQFGKIEKNARRVNYETALDWLSASNLVLESRKVNLPKIPISGFASNDFFKLYVSDVGILVRSLGIKFKDILLGNLGTFGGALAENYVACEFAANDIPLFYWGSDGKAEVDFLIYNDDGIIPVEAKAGRAVRSKSLTVYGKKYDPKYSIRISARNFGFENEIKSVPLYAAFLIM